MEKTDYRPKEITFEVTPDESIMPESFGSFVEHKDVLSFIAKTKMTTVNQSLTVNRHMDQVEKKEIREEYQELLESELPKLEKKLYQVAAEAKEAKEREKDATEMVNAAISKVKILSKEVRAGLKAINLDDLYTFRIPYRNKYYYYTWINQELKICKICDIPEHEKTQIWNAMASNEEYIESKYGEGPQTTSKK